LGFEAMVACIAGVTTIEGMENCINYNSNVIPLCDIKSSKILSKLTPQSLNAVCNNPAMFNNHYYSIKSDKISKVEANGILKCIAKSLSSDKKCECLTIVEGCGYPFYGVQFHPEVSLQMYFNSVYNPVVSAESAELARELMSIFIEECKKRVVTDVIGIPLLENMKGERVLNKFNQEICLMWGKI
jgi:hypothetical protein